MILKWETDRQGRRRAPHLDGSWMHVPLGKGSIALPPNGVVLPYSIAGAMMLKPQPNRVLSMLTSMAIHWLEEVHGESLAGMIHPFEGDHDFSILCGGTPVRLRSTRRGWEMSYQLGGATLSYEHRYLGNLVSSLADLFGPEGHPNLSQCRRTAFCGEACDMLARISIAEQITGQGLRRHRRESGETIGVMVTRAMDELKMIDRREIELHRYALGRDDKADTFEATPKSWETLFDQLRRDS